MTDGEGFGRYRLLHRIGVGAATELFRAKSFGVEGFEKTLVIKRVVPELCVEPRYARAFVPAAQLAVRLSHANVVQVFDLGKVEQAEAPAFYLAMEWVPGLDLGELVTALAARGERVPPAVALWVVTELCKALDHAHRRRDDQLRPLGVVHGDPNPRNVRFSLEGEVKLADFCITRGLLGLTEDPAHAHRLAGKWATLAPEVAFGAAPSPASDLYGLGVLLHDLLVGRLSRAASPEEARRLAERRARQLALTPHLPVPLRPLLGALLAPDPAARPESAAELHDRLSELRYGLSELAGAAELAALIEGLPKDQLTVRRPQQVSELDLETTQIERTPAAAPEPTSRAREASSPPSGPPRSAPPSRRGADTRAVPDLAAQARDATVLVVRFSERGGAPAPVRERARETLRRWGAKVLGDSPHEISATFGLELADGRDAENAARCALVLTRSLTTPSRAVSVGLAVGALRAGTDGQPADDERRRALLLAARRQALVAPGGVALSRQDARHLRGLFALEDPPEPSHRTSWIVAGNRAVGEALGRFAGRKHELRWLGEAIARASRRKLQLVRIEGPPGIGKTRLVLEMERRLSRTEHRVACHVATCPPLGRELPLSGVSAMLRAVGGVRDGDPPDRVAAAEPGLRALGLVEDQVRAVLGELGGPAAQGGEDLLGSAIARMLGTLSSEQVTVLVWDDAQHLDPASEAVLRDAVGRAGTARAVLVLVTRDTADGGAAVFEAAERLLVGPLGDEDVARLVALRTGLERVPPELFQFVRTRSAGHPMFVEELLHEALASGALEVSGGEVTRLELGGALAVPRPLRSLLSDRVRRLGREQRDLLVAASVLGNPVDTSVLAAMLEVPLGAVNALAESLESLELVRRAGPVALRFLSPLLPEVVLGALPPELLLALHRQAANAYQIVLAERTEEEAARIAFHLDRAGEPDRAAGYYATSGLAALSRRRPAVAAHDLSRALLLADHASRSPHELASWLSGLARVARSVREPGGMLEAGRRLARGLADTTADPESLAQMHIDLGRVFAALHQFSDAHGLLDRAIRHAEGRSPLLRAALTAKAELSVREGQLASALSVVERLEQVPPGEGVEGHRALLAAAQALGAAGRTAEALLRVEQARALVDPADAELGAERAKASALAHAFAGDWRACSAACQEAAELAREADLAQELAVHLHNQGDALLHLGDLARAYAALEASLAVSREIGATRWVNVNRLMLAYLEARNGSADGEVELRERLARAEREGWLWDAVTGRALLGALLAHRGERDVARATLLEARAQAARTGNLLVLRDCDAELEALGS